MPLELVYSAVCLGGEANHLLEGQRQGRGRMSQTTWGPISDSEGCLRCIWAQHDAVQRLRPACEGPRVSICADKSQGSCWLKS